MIEQDPRVTEGPNFFRSLYDWMRRVAIDLNAKATINNAVLTGDPQAPTPPVSDNDNSIATTAWVRSAMGTIFSALGFSVGGTNAVWYIKFPTFMGSFILQGGSVAQSSDASGLAVITFPISFASAPVGISTINGEQANQFVISPGTGTFVTASNCTYVLRNPAAAWATVGSTAHRVNWIAGGF